MGRAVGRHRDRPNPLCPSLAGDRLPEVNLPLPGTTTRRRHLRADLIAIAANPDPTVEHQVGWVGAGLVPEDPNADADDPRRGTAPARVEQSDDPANRID